MRCLNSTDIERFSGTFGLMPEIGITDGLRRQEIYVSAEKALKCLRKVHIAVQRGVRISRDVTLTMRWPSVSIRRIVGEQDRKQVIRRRGVIATLDLIIAI